MPKASRLAILCPTKELNNKKIESITEKIKPIMKTPDSKIYNSYTETYSKNVFRYNRPLSKLIMIQLRKKSNIEFDHFLNSCKIFFKPRDTINIKNNANKAGIINRKIMMTANIEIHFSSGFKLFISFVDS